MPRCTHTETCPFFTAEIGFSPELHDAMKARYCLGDSSTCARLLASQLLGSLELVPTDMLPSDEERLAALKK